MTSQATDNASLTADALDAFRFEELWSPPGSDGAPPMLSAAAIDQMAERAAWTLALAAWLTAPDAGGNAAAPAAPAPPGDATEVWSTLAPHASDWWL
jgi:hypothetical protein